jgi:RNA polymerase sigma-70 factor (ECF subfamily)
LEDGAVLDATFQRAYPLACRAAQVYAAAAVVAGTLPGADRADVVQEALLGLWRALPRFDPARASLRTFAERVIANQVASTARAQRAVRRPVPAEAAAYSEHPGTSIELRIDIRRVVGRLQVGEQHLALLLSNYSPAEASRILRTSRSTVYLRINRIRQAFRDAGLGPERISH